MRVEDNKFPLSVILGLLEDSDFVLNDLLDVIATSPIKYIRLLGKSHFYLSFRLHTLYWAIVINLDSILEGYSSKEDTHPWISVVDLLDDYRLITKDITLITRALSSNVPTNLEPRMVGNVLQIRITPNIHFLVNPFDITDVPSPFDYHSRDIATRRAQQIISQ